MTDSVALIGNPVEHSLSPAFQNAAFAFHGLPDRYILWPSAVDELPQRIAALRQPPMRGANVTLPYKQAVVPMLDELDAVAAAVGAANTIVLLPDGRLHGSNTDVPGFLGALEVAFGSPADRRFVMLGAGGAARAVAYSLVSSGARSLAVVNRTVETAEDLLADLLADSAADPELHAVRPDDPDLGELLAAADVLINATSVGLDGRSLPLPADQIPPRALVIDLIYGNTPLLRAAAERGNPVQDGLEMLVQQGARSFEIWTELPAPVDVMRAAAQRALKERH